MRRPLLQTLVGAALLPALWAHNGSDFIVLDDYDVGHPGEGDVSAMFDLERFDGADELSANWSFFASPMPRVGVGVDVRFAEDGRGDWVYSSVSPSLQLQLTDPHSERPIRVGMLFGYQFAEDLSYDERTTTFEDIVIRKPGKTREVVVPVVVVDPSPGDGGGDGGGEPACNPLFDLDCPPPTSSRSKRHSGSHAPVVTGTTTTTVSSGEETEIKRVGTTTTTRKGVSSHRGIHDHDSRQWFGRLIIETDIGKTKVVGNLISTFPDDDHAYWGYGIGARRPVAEKLAAGIEFVGDFLEGGEHEVVASFYYQIGERASARLGVGVGLSDESADLSLRTGLLWKF